MTLKDLWMLYEADKRILGFSTHTMKAYFLQLKMLVRELGDLEIEEISLKLLKDYFARDKYFRIWNSVIYRYSVRSK
jgi:hypothetical protein